MQDPTIIHIPNITEFSIMTELVQCTDIGFESQTIIFTDNGELHEALDVLKQNNVKFTQS